jgi:osmotically inducible protein OsmC
MIRKASAIWKGGLKDGNGTVSTETNTVSNAAYNFAQRFEDKPGTNPEELVAAAHAACYSMALSATLEKNGTKADSVETKASLTLEKLDLGFTVTRIHLDVTAKVPGSTPDAFLAAAEAAKRGCPISRLLNTTITLEAKLA